MRLYVTQKDFDEGVEANCHKCPVGRSANRAAKRYGYSAAEVGHSNIRFQVVPLGRAGSDCVRPMPCEVSLFILNFDRGSMYVFKPFSFEIQDIPDLTASS